VHIELEHTHYDRAGKEDGKFFLKNKNYAHAGRPQDAVSH